MGGLLILSCCYSIIIIIYGNKFIIWLDIEKKYPKIAKFIELRQKLQQYYLKISFVWIFLCVLPQIGMYLLILLPKLIDFFS